MNVPGAPPPSTTGESRRRLLLVDDDDTMHLVCRRAFAGAQPTPEILTATSGEEALDLIQREAVDVVLSDFRMGVVTGTDVLAAALAKDAAIVRILMSGFGDPTMIAAARERARIHDFIEKPILTRELIALLQSRVLPHLSPEAST